MIAGGAPGVQAGFVEQVVAPAAFPVQVSARAGAIDLSWAVVAGAVRYLVYCGRTADALQRVGETAALEFSLSGLQAAIYFVQVVARFASRQAVAPVFDGGSGAQRVDLTQVPQAPANLVVVQSCDAHVDLAWSQPGSVAGLEFNLYVGGASGAESLALGGVQGSAVRAPGVNGVANYYRVQAVNGIYLSGLSNEVSAAAVLNPAPSGLVAAPGDGSVALSWAAADGAVSYDVCMGTSSGGEALVANTGATSATVGGLDNGATYYFTVATVNACGQVSLPSDEVSAMPANAPCPNIGLSWLEASGVRPLQILNAGWNGSRFVALYGNGGNNNENISLYSADGRVWNQGNLVTSRSVTGMGADPVSGLCIAFLFDSAASPGQLWTSIDGVNWTLQNGSFQLPIDSTTINGWELVLHNGLAGVQGRWLGFIGSGTYDNGGGPSHSDLIGSSSDGVNWTIAPSPLDASSGTTYAAAYGLGRWILSGVDGNASIPATFCSDDQGVTWTRVNIPYAATDYNGQAIATDGRGTWLLVTDESWYKSTDNGNSFAQVTPVGGQPASNNTPYYLSFLDRFAVGYWNSQLTSLSLDGINWIDSAAMGGSFSPANLMYRPSAVGGEVFVAYGTVSYGGTGSSLQYSLC